ncbi:hypothetical protein [Allorhizobium sonneratiae]|uniref:hypothetical protein n=1 Tax=Allorhizobium sonneratiae TaxID=2934936 RepID=UPI00203335FB|nr:hypothetical protein [Allorhizobium sonneratiae]
MKKALPPDHDAPYSVWSGASSECGGAATDSVVVINRPHRDGTDPLVFLDFAGQCLSDFVSNLTDCQHFNQVYDGDLSRYNCP